MIILMDNHRYMVSSEGPPTHHLWEKINRKEKIRWLTQGNYSLAAISRYMDMIGKSNVFILSRVGGRRLAQESLTRAFSQSFRVTYLYVQKVSKNN